MMFALKCLSLAAVTAVAWLWESGDYWLALGALPMLASMWFATRLYARRRARGEPA